MNFSSLNRGRTGVRATLALAVLAALSAANASAAPAIGTLAAPTHLNRGDAVLGALPMTMPIQVVVGLKLRNREALEDFVQEGADAVANNGIPKLMSDEDALTNHAPTLAQAQAVADYLTARGFHNVTISPSRLLVSADGTAQTARDAFMTTFAQVRTKDGRLAYANTDAVRLPPALAGTVDSVLGLQDVHVPRSLTVRAAPGSVHTMDLTIHSPVDFSSIYYAGSVAPATSIPVGIVTNGNLAQVRADLATFTTSKGLAPVATQTVDTAGTSGDTTHVADWDLASQSIVGMSGGVDKLVFYNVPSLSNANLTKDLDTIESKGVVKIIEDSFGQCESDVDSGSGGDGSAQTDDAILLLAAAKGQTFAVATGDSGADECGNGTNTPSYPASSPWVVAVAGTRVGTSGTSWGSERAWTQSGGSPSTFEPMPAWQKKFGVTGTKRGVADVAYDADPNTGAQVVVNGASTQHGGTALSASLFAGMWARVLQAHPYYGFAAPMVYQLPAGDFHDVAAGTNSGGEAGIGFDAVPGYDFASGRGSLKISGGVADIEGKSQQLFYNTGFEGTKHIPGFRGYAWIMHAGAWTRDMIPNYPKGAHTGNRYVSLNWRRGDELIRQSVKIPAGKTTATLRFWLRIATRDTGTTANDTLQVNVTQPNSGYGIGVIETLGTYSNLDASPNYVERTFDVSKYIGKAIGISFYSLNNFISNGRPEEITTFCLDDVTLTVE